MFNKIIKTIIIVCVFTNNIYAQKIANFEIGIDGLKWVDSVFNTLTPERKLGQLFMIAEFSDLEKTTKDETTCLIKEYGLGGICFFKGTPLKQALLTNYLQSISKVPMLISMDAEFGLAMRLDSVVSYPKQMALGSSNDTNAIYHFADDVAKQCKRLGVHVSFSPVADVNNNRLNPVIGDRSFGEDKNKVALYTYAYMKGLEDNHVMACAKHFPGHGNTISDSHLDLPLINQPRAEIDSVELYPFKYLFKHNIKSIMAGHLYIPAIDSTPLLATSISQIAIKELLRKELKYDGLVYTDALNMKGVSKYYLPHELNLKALKADNDVLLYAEDIPQSISYILSSVRNGSITQEEIDNKVKRILAAKYWCGLNHFLAIDTTNLYEDLNKPEYVYHRNDVAIKSVIVLKNENNLIPFQFKKNKKTLLLNVGYNQPTTFEKRANLYLSCKIVNIDKNESKSYFDSIYQWIDEQDFDIIIASLHSTSRFITKKYGFTTQAVSFVNQLPKKKTIYIHFGNLYAIDSFPNFKNIILAHEDWEYWHHAAAEILFTGYGINHKASMPITASDEYKLNQSDYNSQSINNHLSFATGYAVGINEKKLYKIDSICNEAILQKAMPGCQVLAAKDGKVFYYKSFGTFSYNDTVKVSNESIYDIASVSKILSTTLAVMKLYSQHKIDLNAKLSKYIKELRKTNKKDITIREALTHTAGLQEWIPFYTNTKKDDTTIYSTFSHNEYIIQVADSMYMNKNYIDSMYAIIYRSPLKNQGQYAYSDIGFILLKKVVEKVSGDKFDDYVKDNIYKPLSLNYITWNPLKNGYTKSKIVPTENDTIFRKQLIQGYVHDPAAAMMGGIGGHAGLFSNAFDVAQLMQFLLNKGTYNMLSLFSPAVVDTFIQKQWDVRRGLGFDKTEVEKEKSSPCSKKVGNNTFGHQGFTGTCTWADPSTGIIYVFLSNRVNPSASNTKLSQLSVRTSIQDIIYESIDTTKLKTTAY